MDGLLPGSDPRRYVAEDASLADSGFTGAGSSIALRPITTQPFKAAPHPQVSKPGTWPPFLVNHWEAGALASLVITFLALLATVLWPVPDSIVTLKAFPTQQSVTQVSNPAGASAESVVTPSGGSAEEPAVQPDVSENSTNALAKSTSHPKKRYPHTPKKPKHPPILNLNSASLSQLQLLPGIGPKMAQRIISYRKEHGAFTDTAQVMDVKGIGPKKFEKMKAFLKI